MIIVTSRPTVGPHSGIGDIKKCLEFQHLLHTFAGINRHWHAAVLLHLYRNVILATPSSIKLFHRTALSSSELSDLVESICIRDRSRILPVRTKSFRDLPVAFRGILAACPNLSTINFDFHGKLYHKKIKSRRNSGLLLLQEPFPANQVSAVRFLQIEKMDIWSTVPIAAFPRLQKIGLHYCEVHTDEVFGRPFHPEPSNNPPHSHVVTLSLVGVVFEPTVDVAKFFCRVSYTFPHLSGLVLRNCIYSDGATLTNDMYDIFEPIKATLREVHLGHTELSLFEWWKTDIPAIFDPLEFLEISLANIGRSPIDVWDWKIQHTQSFRKLRFVLDTISKEYLDAIKIFLERNFQHGWATPINDVADVAEPALTDASSDIIVFVVSLEGDEGHIVPRADIDTFDVCLEIITPGCDNGTWDTYQWLKDWCRRELGVTFNLTWKIGDYITDGNYDRAQQEN
ncbi:hypothetical protein ABKN59_010482 [Abortiporus biennis]